jgi:hypothetical protein
MMGWDMVTSGSVTCSQSPPVTGGIRASTESNAVKIPVPLRSVEIRSDVRE